MPQTSMPPIERGLSSSPPICDDEANTGGKEAKAIYIAQISCITCCSS